MAAPVAASHPPYAGEPRRPTHPARSVADARIIDGVEFQRLLRLKRRVVGPMLAGGLGFFLVTLALAGFARPLMAEKIAGPLNLGYGLVLGVYAMCWGLAILYAFLAETCFDPQAARAIAEREARS
ncbi:DUF485 domain-containing protein [Methylobacterium sp. J-068]|uniref:DUF485 domain-containing protein n=1 Tax=Methylobacterium sp. J-068 TaxID=2836649 RepID=UPI001FBB86DD|nr:DUF485 domain-containing protein [Methylobacterium sp. J-068]MCJ2035332.1 DUF485 domain-containing protein [Methylobacterium sp. J-068]